jgi:aspartyl-tRNA(Asn)/glutamyl-tRNA(Gln) amidotransferase subunit B
MVALKRISRGAGRELLDELIANGGDAEEVAGRLGLEGGDDEELAGIVEQAIASQPDAAAKVKAGEGKAIGAIVGVVMRETKGRADGGEVTRLIREQLGL